MWSWDVRSSDFLAAFGQGLFGQEISGHVMDATCRMITLAAPDSDFTYACLKHVQTKSLSFEAWGREILLSLM